MIGKYYLKIFYKKFNISPIKDPKYFGFYELIGDDHYPKVTPEKFIKILNLLWMVGIGMNANKKNLSRIETYPERVFGWLAKQSSASLDPEKFATIAYEIKELFKGEV